MVLRGLLNSRDALADVAPWIEFQRANQKIACSIPSQDICLGCSPGPQLGACERQRIGVSLPLSFPSLSENK